MALDPRTPVIIGGGQWSNRVDRGEPSVEPVDLIAEGLRRAAESTSVGSDLLKHADSIRIVQMLTWRYTNPAAIVAERIGASPRDTALSPLGGNEPQTLLNQACVDIAAGHCDVVLIAGAEAWRSRQIFPDFADALGWIRLEDRSDPAPRMTGEEEPLLHSTELMHHLGPPTNMYPLFDQALRHSLGRSVDEHMVHVSRLWSRFSEVAADNPQAWVRRAMTAEEVRTPSSDNRWISWPYTKVMNANNSVDQGAGFIVTSVEKAEALGVPRDLWVFPLAGSDSHDHYFVGNRADLSSSPAIRLAGRDLFELASLGPDDVAYVDLYSCFPSAVQIAASELGFSTDRDLTVTGGLSFAGGPWGNYVSHSLTTMLDLLRADPGAIGLCSANGGYLTKHSFGLFSTEPPAQPFCWSSPQDEVDALPRRDIYEPEADAGPANGVVESWTVPHTRENTPERGVAAVILEDGSRAFADTTDPDEVTELVSGQEQIGRQVTVTVDGKLRL